MKVVVVLIVFSVLFSSCENNEHEKEIKTFSNKFSAKKKQREISSTRDLLPVTEKADKLFNPYVYNKNRKYDITIEDSFDFELFPDSIIRTIQSIRFDRVDTIGVRFKAFRNVQHISIRGYKKIQIDISNFPSLKTIEVFGSELVFTNNSDFSKIKALSFVKSSVHGIKSIRQFSNLKYLKIEYSEFFSSEFELNHLTALEELSIVAYMGVSKVNLRTVNIEMLPNLNSLRISDDFGKVIGIPTNIPKRKWSYFYIYNRDVTFEEKKIIREFNIRNVVN